MTSLLALSAACLLFGGLAFLVGVLFVFARNMLAKTRLPVFNPNDQIFSIDNLVK